MRMWFVKTWFMAPFMAVMVLSVFLSVFLFAAPAVAEIEQSGRSGQPLAVFCNIAPELSTQRSDSVDNWVRICSLWLNYSCKAKKSGGKPGGKPGGKKINYEAYETGRSKPLQPGFRLIGHGGVLKPGS